MYLLSMCGSIKISFKKNFSFSFGVTLKASAWDKKWNYSSSTTGERVVIIIISSQSGNVLPLDDVFISLVHLAHCQWFGKMPPETNISVSVDITTLEPLRAAPARARVREWSIDWCETAKTTVLQSRGHDHLIMRPLIQVPDTIIMWKITDLARSLNIPFCFIKVQHTLKIAIIFDDMFPSSLSCPYEWDWYSIHVMEVAVELPDPDQHSWIVQDRLQKIWIHHKSITISCKYNLKFSLTLEPKNLLWWGLLLQWSHKDMLILI